MTKSAQQNRPTKICHVSCKIARACSIFVNFVGRIFVYRTTNFVYVAMVIVYNGG